MPSKKKKAKKQTTDSFGTFVQKRALALTEDKASEQDKAVAALALGIYRMKEAGFKPREIEHAIKDVLDKLREEMKPYPFCYGNPTLDDCIEAGHCKRNRACND